MCIPFCLIIEKRSHLLSLFSLDNAYTCAIARQASKFAIAILGDLHLEPSQMHIFNKAAEQVRNALSAEGTSSRVVQVGDLGGYNHKPGDSQHR